MDSEDVIELCHKCDYHEEGQSLICNHALEIDNEVNVCNCCAFCRYSCTHDLEGVS